MKEKTLVIADGDHYEQVRAFAKERGLLAEFLGRIDYLTCWAPGTATRTVLSRDIGRDHRNFAFAVYNREKPGEPLLMNGGLIFHDDHWGVHT